MILPIGNNCNLAGALRQIGIRKHSYPFDWIVSDLVSNAKILCNLAVMSKDKIIEFCDEFFNHSTNKLLPNGNPKGDTIFVNLEYDIAFPHDELSTLKEKYTRRFIRMVEDLNFSESVQLCFVCRSDNNYAPILIDLLNKLNNIRPRVTLITVNVQFTKNRNDIRAYHIDYKKDYMGDPFGYDAIYEKELEKLFKTVFSE